MLKNMVKGQYYQIMSGNDDNCILLDVIKDTKIVCLISNCLHPSSRMVVKRKEGRETVEYLWPASIGINLFASVSCHLCYIYQYI